MTLPDGWSALSAICERTWNPRGSAWGFILCLGRSATQSRDASASLVFALRSPTPACPCLWGGSAHFDLGGCDTGDGAYGFDDLFEVFGVDGLHFETQGGDAAFIGSGVCPQDVAS